MQKPSLIVTFIILTIAESCHHTELTHHDLKESKTIRIENWQSITLNLDGKQVHILHDDKLGELLISSKTDSLTLSDRMKAPTNTSIETAQFEPSETDSIYIWSKQLTNSPTLPNKYCTDYAGHLKLTIAYNEQVRQSCEFSSICDWQTMSTETEKLALLLKKKFRLLK